MSPLSRCVASAGLREEEWRRRVRAGCWLGSLAPIASPSSSMPAPHELRNPILGSLVCQHPVRVLGPAVLEAVPLAEGEQLDQALIGRIRLDGEPNARE
jgi:hypothetical protein